MREEIAKLRAQLTPMQALTKAALKAMAAGNGNFWKEAVGELHSQYSEIVLWVLLYEDGDLLETHAALCETLRPTWLHWHQWILKRDDRMTEARAPGGKKLRALADAPGDYMRVRA